VKHHALQLYDYHMWANKKVFQHLKALPEGVYFQEVESVFPSISQLMVHLYRIDIVWLGVIRGESFNDIIAAVGRIPADMGQESIEHIESMYAELAESYNDFLHSQEDLNRVITCEHPQFGKLETQLHELMQHITNHGTYHRGNLTAMLRQMGHPGVPTDYIFYMYAGSEEK
jgi:uncharacterized damage-inducible protein DinB